MTCFAPIRRAEDFVDTVSYSSGSQQVGRGGVAVGGTRMAAAMVF